jgi:hypothetical protein
MQATPNGYPVHPAHSSSTPGTILGHVQAIRAAHHRLTGRTLPWETAIGQLDRFNATQDADYPVKLRDVQVGCYLISERYEPAAINKVLAYTAIFGRAHDCPDLDPGDAEAIDELMAAEAHFFLAL